MNAVPEIALGAAQLGERAVLGAPVLSFHPDFSGWKQAAGVIGRAGRRTKTGFVTWSFGSDVGGQFVTFSSPPVAVSDELGRQRDCV